MKKSLLFVVFASLLWASSGSAYGQSISITQISPSSPADLAHEEEVTIQFEYTISEPGGARIFIRPMTDGSRSPNYAASGSRVYQGSGSSTANFTITSGNIEVDQLRVQVIRAGGQQVLAEFLMPVDFSFSDSEPNNQFPVIHNDQFPVTEIPDSIPNINFTKQVNSIPEDAEIERRTIKPDGTLEIYYSGGYVRGMHPGGGGYIVSPAGDTTRALVPMIGVQDADQPETPLGIAESAGSESQKTLLRQLDKWMKAHSDRLMTSITELVTDEEALQNYKNYEQETCDSIYDRISLRYEVLEKLVQGETF